MHRSRILLLGAVVLGLMAAAMVSWLPQRLPQYGPQLRGAASPSGLANSTSPVSPASGSAQAEIIAPVSKGENAAAGTAQLQLAPSRSAIRYSRRELERATAHVVTVPAGQVVEVAIASPLETVDHIAQQAGAITAINAGFFDPQNGQTTSHVILDGEVVADPRQNLRLMENPDLADYLPQILNRAEFRRYACGADAVGGATTRYAIVPRDTPPAEGCRIVDAVGGGPRLVPELTSVTEGFVAVEAGERVRDALAETQPNARSAVGITATGDVVLVAAAQRPDLQRSGLTLAELAELMRALGAETALNLDGGSSTTLYYRGQVYLGRWVDGQPIERPVKTVLMVTH